MPECRIGTDRVDQVRDRRCSARSDANGSSTRASVTSGPCAPSRIALTDTNGHLIALRVHAASIQDRDGAPEVFRQLTREAPKLRHVYADGGYAGPKVRDALTDIGRWVIQIVKRSDTAEGFEVLPRRWVVERTFAWLGKCRRLARDWEKTVESAEAWILIAHIRRMTRHIARA